MCFYHILTLKHVIRYQKITLYTYQSLQSREWKKYIQCGLQAQKNESLTLKQVLKQKKTFVSEVAKTTFSCRRHSPNP